MKSTLKKRGKNRNSPHPPAFTLWSVRNCTVMTLDSDFKMGGMDVWFPQYRPISLAVLVLLPLNAATKSYRHLEWSSISKELNLQIEKKKSFRWWFSPISTFKEISCYRTLRQMSGSHHAILIESSGIIMQSSESSNCQVCKICHLLRCAAFGTGSL